MNTEISLKYTGLDNKLQMDYGKNLIYEVVYKDKQSIFNLVEQIINSENHASLKGSLALCAYIHERDIIDREVVVFLLNSGVNPNDFIYNRIPLHGIYYKLRTKRLIYNPTKEDEVNFSFAVGDFDYDILSNYLDLLIQFKANLNIIDENGNTLINNACYGCDLETIKLLIIKGASVLTQNDWGESALSIMYKVVHDMTDSNECEEKIKTGYEIIALLVEAVKKEMAKLGIITEKQF